jgi:HSP20 family protein
MIMSALIRWSPRTPLLDAFRRDPFFGTLFSDLGSELDTSEGSWAPTMDLVEEKDALLARFDLPGIDPKEVELSLQGDLLTIKGERREEREEKDSKSLRREQFYGAFQRTVKLPCNVDVEKVRANSKNGVMVIRMPKAAEFVGRRIPIESKD